MSDNNGKWWKTTEEKKAKEPKKRTKEQQQYRKRRKEGFGSCNKHYIYIVTIFMIHDMMQITIVESTPVIY